MTANLRCMIMTVAVVDRALGAASMASKMEACTAAGVGIMDIMARRARIRLLTQQFTETTMTTTCGEPLDRPVLPRACPPELAWLLLLELFALVRASHLASLTVLF